MNKRIIENIESNYSPCGLLCAGLKARKNYLENKPKFYREPTLSEKTGLEKLSEGETNLK
ncbi:MAG: hypothetical protein PHU63_04190 [Candidatus ainarchaeum sp.]|nr:hypothetical protein [Candidatus ainarchaeum sp.]